MFDCSRCSYFNKEFGYCSLEDTFEPCPYRLTEIPKLYINWKGGENNESTDV